jgi:predicted protein tyrosine phosphatase
MTTIEVCPRQTAANMHAPEFPWAVISIKNPDMSPLEFPTANCLGVLALDFDDADRQPDQSPMARESTKYTLFTAEMAEKVWDFVEGVWDKADVLLIHCNHGMSRSPAVAAAIAKTKHGDDQEWFRRKSPNRLVYRLMLETAQRRGLS